MIGQDGLPSLKVDRGMRKGRSPADGYTRGWGLEFGNLREQLLSDPVYGASSQLAEGRSVQAELRRMNIYLIIKHFLARIPHGNIIELGAYKGGSSLFMANAAKAFLPKVNVIAFDTFRGMPYADRAIDAHSAGDFSGVDLAELRAFAEEKAITNLQFVQGKFEDTLAEALPSIAPIALVHIDCDVRDAVVYSYETVKKYLVPGAYIVFDDATVSSCIGATEAIEELLIQRDGLFSEQIFPHFVFRQPPAADGDALTPSP